MATIGRFKKNKLNFWPKLVIGRHWWKTCHSFKDQNKLSLFKIIQEYKSFWTPGLGFFAMNYLGYEIISLIAR